MNRSDLRRLATTRLQDAEVLLANRRYAGAYYLAGYSVECALKACIARNTKRGEFPDKVTVQNSHIHDLSKLVKVAGLGNELNIHIKSDSNFDANWALTITWNETSRYEFRRRTEARDLLAAVSDQQSGVLSWLMNHW